MINKLDLDPETETISCKLSFGGGKGMEWFLVWSQLGATPNQTVFSHNTGKKSLKILLELCDREEKCADITSEDGRTGELVSDEDMLHQPVGGQPRIVVAQPQRGQHTQVP